MTDRPSFRRILVPLDGSDTALRAVTQARRLAHLFDARLWLVTVEEPGDEVGAADAALVAGADAAGDTPAEVERIAGNDPHQVLAALNDEHPDALCCMSTTGRTAFTRALFGSVARSVIDRSTEPVVVVGPSCRDEPDAIDHVTVALDGSAESELAVTWASRWAQEAGVPLEVIRVVHPLPDPSARVAPTEEQLDDLRYVHLTAADLEQPETVRSRNLAASDPVEALSQHLRQFDGALMAMSTRAADAMDELVTGSVAASLVRHSPTPIALTSHTV